MDALLSLLGRYCSINFNVRRDSSVIPSADATPVGLNDYDRRSDAAPRIVYTGAHQAIAGTSFAVY